MQLTGRYFAAECPPSPSVPAGGGGCAPGPRQQQARPPETPRPLQDVRLELRQGGRTWQLGEADAQPDASTVAWPVRVPEAERPGRAKLVATAEGIAPVELDVEITRQPRRR